MIKKLLFIVPVFLSLTLHLWAQGSTLVMVHPTEYNLNLFTHLVSHEIIVVDDLKILGVYHAQEAYDYSRSVSFVENHPELPVTLLEVHDEIRADQLYQENQCTGIYTELFNRSDGILFMGGPDLPPAIYNEPMRLLTRMTDPYRHYFEASFIFHLLGGDQHPDFIPLLERKPEYPVYAICLGMQTMNVAAGGTLVQDIPSEVYYLQFVEEVLEQDNNKQHRNYHNNLNNDTTLFSGNFHQLKLIDPGPLVGETPKNPEPLVYSNHHQAIEKLGKGLVVIATSADGKIIEAIAHEKYPNVLGIQFHPEGVYLHDPYPRYRKKPVEELKSGKQILEENESYTFHLKFWEYFSRRFNGEDTDHKTVPVD